MVEKLEDESRIASIKPFGLRLQPGLKKRLEDVARKNNRSLNAEITARLDASLTASEGWLEKSQRSPSTQSLKEGIAADARLEGLVDKLAERIAVVEKHLGLSR